MRLFATMAALNAAGFDVELGSQYHPVRAALRKVAEGVDRDLVERLRQFYAARKGDQTDEAQLAKYISLAVMLTDAPELKPVVREEGLPPDAREVMGFAELVREFYQKARLTQQWVDVRAQYEEEIDRLGPRLREVFLRTDAYLRVPTASASAGVMRVVVELAAPVNSVNIRSDQDDYYVVIGSSPNARVIDEIRHAYLHFHLDGLVARNVNKIADRARLLALVANDNGIRPEFARDALRVTTESLIRAIELRLDRTPSPRAEEAVRSYYRSGLLLHPYFYEALQKFEEADGGIRDAFGVMAEQISFRKEEARFRETFHTIPIPPAETVRAEVPPAPRVDPVRELLKEAETAFNAGDNERARRAFEKVVSENPEHPAALYGLGLIASREEDSEQARRYFERVASISSADPSVRVWAHVFLGRIFDLDCERSRAVEHYREAARIGDNTRNAQAAAKEGLSKPWGDACP